VAELDSAIVLDVTALGGGLRAVGKAKRREFLSKFAVGDSLWVAMASQGVDAVPYCATEADERKVANLLQNGSLVVRQPRPATSAG
jgi:hypothetical protein